MNNSVLGRDFSLRSKWHSLFVISITTKLLFFASRCFLSGLSEERSPATASHIKCSFTLNFSLLTFYLSLPLSSRTRLSWGISKNHTALKNRFTFVALAWDFSLRSKWQTWCLFIRNICLELFPKLKVLKIPFTDQIKSFFSIYLRIIFKNSFPFFYRCQRVRYISISIWTINRFNLIYFRIVFSKIHF